MKIRTVLGSKIIDRRNQLGMSAADLSKLSRIPKSTLSELENKTGHPSVYTVYKLSKALNCSIEYLIT